jgi:LAO/AO transport system kinase
VPTSISSWVDEIRGGNLRALSQAITAVENRTPESQPLLRALFAYSGRARMVGITGAPGAGKSTLVDGLAGQFRRRQQTVGILAIDPTSPFSGGAILGDRIRMQSHTTDDGIFIRSMATRVALGGLCSAAADAATVLDASGRDLVMIETVGAGQDEVDIVRIADLTLVVLVPGMGDDVQSIKAGILEIADIFVINKADREGAARVEGELRAMQSLSTRVDGWVPPIVQTVATSGKGIEGLMAAIDLYEIFLATGEGGRERRIANWRLRLQEMLRDELWRRIDAQALSDAAMEQYAEQVAAHERDPYSLIAELAAQVGAQSAGSSATSSANPSASPLAQARAKDDTAC